MVKKIIGVLLLSAMLMAVTACDGLGGGDSSGRQLVEVTRGDLQLTVSGSGSLAVSEDTSLSFGVGGKILLLNAEEGDTISKGTVLARLDTSALELALNQAIVARDEVQYNLDQLRDVLHSSNDRIVLTEKQLALAEQAITEAQKQLDEAVIEAPFTGLVAATYADEGDFVAMGQPILYLVDMNSLELVVEVDEVDIASIEPGLAVVIEVDALTGTFGGKVLSISPTPTALSGVVVYNVKIGFDQILPEMGLRMGMSATADIITDSRNNVLVIPSRAVTEDDDGNQIVKVLIGEEIEERTVEIGLDDGLDVEIISGLSEGETVDISR
jgi:RND family efflux transporter MFP subunit